MRIDDERSLLSVLLRGADPKPALQRVIANDFLAHFHRRLWAHWKSIVEEGEPLNPAAFPSDMKLEHHEGVELGELLDTRYGILPDVGKYAQAVSRHGKLARLVKSCENLVKANGDLLGHVLNVQHDTANFIDSMRQDADVQGVLASTVKPQTVKWFWPARIPLGKITILDGDPDNGKSLLSVDLASRCTSGRPMPDGTPGPTGGVVLLNAEDDTDDTIVPRLIAAGADLGRVRILKNVKSRDGERQIELPADLDIIRNAALSVTAVLIVIDPLMAFLSSKTNSWRDQDIRRALAPLAQVASELHVAIVVIRHLNKSSEESNPLYRGGGSIGIIGAARAGLVAGADPDDATGETRILAVTKSNLSRKAPSLRYRVILAGENVAIEWQGESQHRASAILSTVIEGPERSKMEECQAFLAGLLSDGARPAKELIQEVRKCGFSERTLDRAKIRANVTTYLAGFGKDGKWMWHIP